MMPDQIEGFLHQIVVMLPAFEAMENRLDRETGRRFSVFDLFGTDEPTTSGLLDGLLNPKGAHGQGGLFLRLFVDRFIPAWRDTFATDDAYPPNTDELIDVASTDGVHWLGIENKIFGAQDQPKQSDRYLDELKHKSSQTTGGDYCLLYLSPTGCPPSLDSWSNEGKARHKGKLICRAWVKPLVVTDAAKGAAGGSDDASPVNQESSVLDWLTECEGKCGAENVRWFLRQFRDFVHARLLRKEGSGMSGDVIVDLAFRSPDYLDAALRIGDRFEQIKAMVIHTLLTSVQRRLGQWVQQRAGDWELIDAWPGGSAINSPGSGLPILLRKRRWPARVGAALSGDSRTAMFYGILAQSQESWNRDAGNERRYGRQTGFIDDDKRQAIAEACKLNQPRSAYWLDWEYLRDIDGRDIRNWTSVETISLLHARNDTLAQHIASKLEGLAEKICKGLG